MTTQEFFDKYNNKGIDFDGYYGFQCMDLAHQFAVEVNSQDFPAAPAAKDVWGKTIAGYDKIANTPDGVPQKGDIIIWGTGVGAYGHIAVFDHGNQNAFTSFDQNWPLNSLCHYQNHNYNGVLGWLRVKVAPSQSPPVQHLEITDQTKIPQIDNKEVQQIKSELQSKNSRIQELDATIGKFDTVIQGLKQEVERLKNAPQTGFKPLSDYSAWELLSAAVLKLKPG